jgi:DNA-binding NtrC family response regulator
LLLVHPDADTAARRANVLVRLAWDVESLCNTEDAPRLAATEPEFPVILVGVSTGRVTHFDPAILDVVAALHRASSRSQIVVLLPTTTKVEHCCQAIEAGVTGFVEVDGDDVNVDMLERRLDEALQRYEQTVAATESLREVGPSDTTPIISHSRLMAETVARAAQAAQVSDAPVLIHGESGTGKQLMAEMIHRLDPKRCDHPFLTVNCASITGTLAESALFGHVQGAFTGATRPRAGYFRTAERGTLLLDEVGDLELTLQPKLLRALQCGAILPVGADTETIVDVRVLAASNRPLHELVESGNFRLDLYQRLNVILLEIPPLRERPEDIEALVPYFVRKYERYYGREINHVDRRVYEFLHGCALDGNVRELENTVRRILALKTSGNEILLTDIPENLRREHRVEPSQTVTREIVESACRMIEQGQVTLPDFIAECERQVLATAISRSKGPATDLAERLGLSRRTFYNKRRKYGI